MTFALNAWSFAGGLSPADQIRAAAAAGFDGLELTLSHDGPLTFGTVAAQWHGLREFAASVGIGVTSLATGVFFQTHYASAEAQAREQAIDLTRRMLDAAAQVGATSIVVVPAIVGRAFDVRPQSGYADALHRGLDALTTLSPHAEARAVTIALENVWNRFLLSPVEAAEFVDRVNSPFVGWCLDIGNIMPFGYPQDWIVNLGRRLAHIHVKDYDLNKPGREGFVALGDGSVDWPAVRDALAAVRYDGPLVFEGPGEPVDILERMRRMLTRSG